MSMPFNPNQYSHSNSNNQSHIDDFGFHGNSVNGQFQILHNSNHNIMRNQNHALLFNSNNYHIDSNVGVDQTNLLISPLNSTTTTHQSRSFVEQFGVGRQSVNNYEVRNTPLLPQRVQVVQRTTSINYVDHFPINQNQYSISSPLISTSLGDHVYVTEVVRTQDVITTTATQLLNSVSTRERFFGHNSWNFHNQMNNNSRANVQTQRSNNDYTQNPNYHGQYYNSQIPNPSFYQNPPNRINIVTDNDATPSPNEQILNPQPVNVYTPDGTSIYPIVVDHNQEYDSINNDINPEEVDDGMTHSLPYKKYGPYTCPKCNGVFTTSQIFAAHMGTHYKDETAAQRRKRRMAKQRKKSMRTRALKLNEYGPITAITVGPGGSSAIGNSVVAGLARNKVDHDDDEMEKEESGVGKGKGKGKEIVANAIPNPMEGTF